ncbi:hypothetical protein [Trinickia sp. EG282A]|uniref:hypothetical protein n=1 Tax=Trinickia sp. EG282A TaxID=3237013 RepID=UPI0034D28967
MDKQEPENITVSDDHEVAPVNSHWQNAHEGLGSRAPTKVPPVNWAWAANNSSFDWMDWHLPEFEPI